MSIFTYTVRGRSRFLDGLGSPDQYAKLASQMNQPALAITDHANLAMAPLFYKACKKNNIDPVIGFEGYFVNSVSRVREEKEAERSHITVLGRGAKGYAVLSEFNTETWRQFYYKPLIDRALCEQLGDDARHLTILSGCAGSQLSRLLLDDREDEAIEEFMWWRETFPNYYIEIMHHDTDFDRTLNERLLKLAERYNVPWVVTNDPHFGCPEDAPAQDAMLAIQMGKDIDDPNRMRFDGQGYWLKSRREMYNTFRRAGYDAEVFRRGAHNALTIARESVAKVKAWETKTWQIPKFPDVDNSFKELCQLTADGLRELGHGDDPVYWEQAHFELRAIRKAGISDFLLWTRAIDRHAASVGIRVGPGRGSVAGCIVGYAIGIHKVDPIKYRLRFDRFYNPERPKMPDIDTDFQKSRRGEVFDYVIKKAGAENTVMVAAFGSMKVKAAFNSLAKAYGIGHGDALRLNREIHEEEDDSGDKVYVLPEEITTNYPDLAGLLDRLSGVKKGIGAHPAGVIIADSSLKIHEQVPQMYIPSSKRWVAAYDKKALEGMGFMKQDLLGLRCLDTIQECIELIKWRTGETIEPDDWIPDEEPDDDKVYRMLAKGETSGVFQMEGPVNQRGCRDVRPHSFEDLVSITSLYRTGPIAAGYPAQFIDNRKRGKNNISYLHPKLKPILEETWGVILYQEQVMAIGEQLAGFNGVLVDEIKEAIKDKSSDEMDRVRPLFIEGCRKNGIKADTATAIWDIIEGYAGYGYNRSHAVAYTLLTYQTARLKYLYPIEFFTALLRTVPNDKDNAEKRENYLRDSIKRANARIEPPHINLSDARAWPDRVEPIIRFGFSDLKGVGVTHGNKLVKNRPADGYTDWFDVEQLVNNTGVTSILNRAGVLDCLGIPGDVDAAEELLGWQFRDPMVEWRERYQHVVTLPSRDGGDVDLVGIIYKVTRGVTKTNKPYATWKIRWSSTDAWDIRMWSECSRHWDLKPGSVVRVRGEWQRRWLNITVPHAGAIEVLHAERDA